MLTLVWDEGVLSTCLPWFGMKAFPLHAYSGLGWRHSLYMLTLVWDEGVLSTCLPWFGMQDEGVPSICSPWCGMKAFSLYAYLGLGWRRSLSAAIFPASAFSSFSSTACASRRAWACCWPKYDNNQINKRGEHGTHHHTSTKHAHIPSLPPWYHWSTEKEDFVSLDFYAATEQFVLPVDWNSNVIYLYIRLYILRHYFIIPIHYFSISWHTTS